MENPNALILPVGYDPKDAQELEIVHPETVNIPDAQTLEQFTDFFRIADTIRKPRFKVWESAWDLYNGRYDWTGKEEWQAKINIPKVRQAVDKAAASFRKALVKMKRFYHIESETKLGIEQGFFTMSLLDYYFDQINFVNEFSTGLKAGLITSTIVFKIYWQYIQDFEPRWEPSIKMVPQYHMGVKIGDLQVPSQKLVKDARVRGLLGIKAVDPFNFWVGPRSNYKIEKATVDIAYLHDMAERGVYSKEAVERLALLSGQAVDAYLEAVRKGEQPDTFLSKFNRPVDLYHYWGDMFNDKGKVIAHNATFTIGGSGSYAPGGSTSAAGGGIVLRKPVANPLMHGKDPYIVGTPYIVPFSTYNRGIVEDIIGIAKMITELSCLIIDGAQFDAMQAYEIDSDLLTDARQAKRGVYPGVAFTTKSYENPTNKNVVRSITTGKVPQLALNILNFLDKEQQLSTSVTNALKGQAVGADTLGEFQMLAGAAGDSLDDAARTVEETVLDDLLDKAAATVYQYHDDYKMPRLMENYPRTALALIDMEPDERYATMVGGFNFKARGVSIFIDKAQDLQKINSFLQLIGNLPGVLPYINIPELLENIIIGIGWNPTRILNTGSNPVYPAAMQGGQPVPGQAGMADPQPQMDASKLTPAQMVAGQAGAQQGGATNNPRAIQAG
jgi:hypothetical protein